MKTHPWLALWRREMVDLTRGFSAINGILRGFLSLGVFLPWLAHALLPAGAAVLFDCFSTLILLVGSSHLVVWVHQTTARQEANHEIMTVAGVSGRQCRLARTAAGLTFVALTATTTLFCLLFLAPFARLSSNDAVRTTLSLTAGLSLSLGCALGVATITPPSPQRMPTILFALLAVWLGLPIAAEWGRQLNLLPFHTGWLPEPAGFLSSLLPGTVPASTLGIGLLLVALGFLLVVGSRSRRRPSASQPRALHPRVHSLLLPPPDGTQSGDPAYDRRLNLQVPDAIVYLRQAAWFSALATLCLVPPGSPWLWIALSATVLGQLFYGAWLWHFSSSLLDEDRQLGDPITHPGRIAEAQAPLHGWLHRISRWSRWTSTAFYLVLTPLAGLRDDTFPWILFVALAAALPLMSAGLTAAARDLSDRTSPVLRDAVGVLVLVAWPLFLGIVLGRFAGPKGFLAGIAVGLLLSLAGVVGLRAVANSPWLLWTRMTLMTCRLRSLRATVTDLR